MVMSCVSTYLALPLERRKGQLRFVAFSGGMLVTHSVMLSLDARQVFRDLFIAGPSGRSYVETFRADVQDLSSRPFHLATAGMADLTAICGDTLMASD